ncbi:MAG: hypothetical protein R3A11_00205 [Bdellovibrionota bacterium]
MKAKMWVVVGACAWMAISTVSCTKKDEIDMDLMKKVVENTWGNEKVMDLKITSPWNDRQNSLGIIVARSVDALVLVQADGDDNCRLFDVNFTQTAAREGWNPGYELGTGGIRGENLSCDQIKM